MRWGLIPSWAKDMSIGNRTLNARSESVTTTPAFRDSILTKRCLIPADGFYEWRKMGSVKQPYCFEVGEGEVFAFAGLWDEWRSPDGEIIESCAILTTGPNSLVADLHDRMPVIVTLDKYDVWLDPDVNDFKTIRDILKPYDANLMRRYPVSRKLNNSKIDDAEAASPVTLDTPTQGQLF
jgi:putative SOS response-associated peptidase YedK